MTAVASLATPAPLSRRQPAALRVTHVISDLRTGGAETMLYKLLAATPAERAGARVVSLLGEGTLGPRIVALGIPVRALRVSPRRALAAAGALRAASRRAAADVVVGWMYHGNLAASLGAALAAGRPVVWNVRHSVYDLAHEKPGTARLIRLGARLSRRAAAIVYNSHTAREQHERLGYAAGRGRVIPNGFDASLFAPSADARASLRTELGLGADVPLLGVVARYHPMKDHAGLLRAAARLAATHPAAHWILAGREVTPDNPELGTVIRELGIAGRVHLLGERADVPRITAALDVAVSPSYSEAFPNAVGEAMACAVPCVVTDVGDSARLVGPTGVVVPPRAPEALAAACAALLDGPARRAELGTAARRRIVEHYDIDAVAARFVALCAAVAARAPLPAEDA